MTFVDRQDAGRKLGQALLGFQGGDNIIFALPRGGVPVAYEVAKILKAPLEIITARKIGHPTHPEYAIGAVTASGVKIFNEIEKETVSKKWLDEKINEELTEAGRRHALYLGKHKSLKIRGKSVIIIDDGIATGLTMIAAVRELKKARPKEIIIALPVAPKGSIEMLKNEADNVIVLYSPEDFFGAVGQYYEDFPQITDGEVLGILKKSTKND